MLIGLLLTASIRIKAYYTRRGGKNQGQEERLTQRRQISVSIRLRSCER